MVQSRDEATAADDTAPHAWTFCISAPVCMREFYWLTVRAMTISSLYLWWQEVIERKTPDTTRTYEVPTCIQFDDEGGCMTLRSYSVWASNKVLIYTPSNAPASERSVTRLWQRLARRPPRSKRFTPGVTHPPGQPLRKKGRTKGARSIDGCEFTTHGRRAWRREALLTGFCLRMRARVSLIVRQSVCPAVSHAIDVLSRQWWWCMMMMMITVIIIISAVVNGAASGVN